MGNYYGISYFWSWMEYDSFQDILKIRGVMSSSCVYKA